MPRNGIDEEINFLIRLSLSNDGILLGIGMGVLALKTWWHFLRHSKALHLLQNTQNTSVSHLRTLIRNEYEQESSNSSQKQRHDTANSEKNLLFGSSPHIQKSLFVVRGIVKSKLKKAAAWPPLEIREVVKSEHSNEDAVIVEKTESCVCIDMRSIFGWLNYRTPVNKTTKTVPFSLHDPHDMNESHALKVNLEGSSHALPLTRTFVKISPSPQSFSSLFFHILLGSRYPIGILEEEKMLKMKTELTAIGHVEVSNEETLTISSSNSMPYFLTEMSKDQLMEEFRIKSKFLLWGGLAVTLFSFAIIGHAIFKKWRRWKLSTQSSLRQNMELFDEEDEMEENPNTIHDGELCIICFSRRRKVVFIRCGHRVCCCTCTRQLFNNYSNNIFNRNELPPTNSSDDENTSLDSDAVPRCPICREVVSCVYRVYDA